MIDHYVRGAVIVVCAEFAWWADAGNIANHMSDVVLLEDTR